MLKLAAWPFGRIGQSPAQHARPVSHDSVARRGGGGGARTERMIGKLSSEPTTGMLRRKPSAIGKKSLRAAGQARGANDLLSSRRSNNPCPHHDHDPCPTPRRPTPVPTCCARCACAANPTASGARAEAEAEGSALLCAPEQVEEPKALYAHADDRPAQQHEPDPAQKARGAWRERARGGKEELCVRSALCCVRAAQLCWGPREVARRKSARSCRARAHP